MLAHPEVARYLLERGLVSAHSIVAGDLLVLNLTRRNSNFKVISKEGPSYLVKQGIGPEKTATIDQEAAVYRLLQTDGAHEEFRRFIPYCYEYDPEQHVLV